MMRFPITDLLDEHLSFAHFESTFANLSTNVVNHCLERVCEPGDFLAKGALSKNHAIQPQRIHLFCCVKGEIGLDFCHYDRNNYSYRTD